MSSSITSILNRRGINSLIHPKEAARILTQGLAAHEACAAVAVEPGSKLHAWLVDRSRQTIADGTQP